MVREIPLTQGFVALVDDEDYDLVSQYNWYPTRRAKTTYARGARRGGPSKLVSLHRLILNPPPGYWVDHISDDGLDCRRCNIRIATPSQNNARKRTSGNKTGFRGVVKHPDYLCWRARINSKSGVRISSWFRSPEEAARAYDELATAVFGAFARLNFGERGEVTT